MALCLAIGFALLIAPNPSAYFRVRAAPTFGRNLVGVLIKRWQATKDMDEWAPVLGAVIRQLRAGATPSNALAAVAIGAPRTSSVALRWLAADRSATGANDPPALSETLCAQVVTVRALLAQSENHGLSLAERLAVVHRDLVFRLAFARKGRAQSSGPRASAVILAALPIGGLLLGETSGAHPLTILVTTSAGVACLAIGLTLLALGAWWSHRIMRSVVRA
jgi:tight adherence protein B